MKSIALSAATIAVTAGSAIAVIREPVTVGTRPIYFAGAASTANGITLPATLSGYTTRGVRLSGQVTTLAAGSWPSDLRMSIFAPGAATPTTVQLDARNMSGTFSVDFAWAPASSSAVPLGMPQIPGDWTITIWDAALDGAGGVVPEARIDSLVISMDDDISPAGASTPLNMTGEGGSILHTFTLGNSVKWYLVTAPDANSGATPPTYFEIFCGGPNTTLADSELSLWGMNTAFNAAGQTAPVNTQQIGARLALDFQDGDGQLAALSFGIGTGIRLGSFDADLGSGADGNLTAGQYYLAVVAGQRAYYARNWSSLAIDDSVDGRVDINWRSGSRVPLPVGVNLGVLPVNQTVPAGAAELTGAKWFKIAVDADIGSVGNRYLDIRTVRGAGAATNTELAIFRELTGGITSGTLVAANDDIAAGSDLFSRLSFGAGASVVSATGGAGQNGSLPGGNTYWIAAANADAAFADGFVASAPPGPDFDVVFASGAREPADSVSVPADATPLAFPIRTTATVAVTVGARGLHWYRLTTPIELSNITDTYLDIWTSPATDPMTRPAGENTMIGLFSGDGRCVVDDDDGEGLYSQLSFGGGVARAALGSSLPFDNRDGALSADTYYIVAGLSDLGVSSGFGLAPGSTDFGEFNLNLRSNYDDDLGCGSLSNVAGPNQSTVPDGALTADDIIVFLGWFFSHDSRANVAGPNQSTVPDAAFTADDIIVFLSRYFEGC